MNIKILITFFLAICLGFSSSAVAKKPDLGNVMILNLVGIGEVNARTVPDIDGDGVEDNANCFNVELFNAKNGNWIGHADDCLSMIVEDEEGRIDLVGTTYFYLPQGTLITRGRTTVQPVTTDITTAATTMTHITGAAGTGNAILAESSGRFMGQTGTVRLSGMVDMSDLSIGKITFDCLFVITLD